MINYVCMYLCYCQKSAERQRPKNIFIFQFLCLTWGLKSGLTSNKPTHLVLNYGDFVIWQRSTIFRCSIQKAKSSDDIRRFPKDMKKMIAFDQKTLFLHLGKYSQMGPS